MTAARKLPPQPDARSRSRVPEAKPLSAFDFLALGMAQTDVKGLVDAGNKYGDDIDREIADLEAGCHPLQRAR